MNPTQTAPSAADVFTSREKARLKYWAERYPAKVMGLVEALREVQDWKGEVPVAADAHIAELFGVTRHRVREIVTFYPYFSHVKAGKYRVAVCRNLSCRLGGCETVLERLEKALGVPEGEATKDGLFSWEASECLGACDHAPAFAVNDELLGKATPEAVDAALSACRSGKAPMAGPSVEPAAPVCDKALLTKHFGEPELHTLAVYRRFGGYAAWEKAKAMEPAAITVEMKKSNVRGLGGAGFPVGMKWETVPPKSKRDVPHALVANADESEPGCFKDRVIMERNPHALVEGLQIAARAIDADHVYIFLRGEYARQRRVLEAAIEEARAAGLLARDVKVMCGANAYISGCDTALLETMEGKKAWPRQPPPFPTVAGLMGWPTVVNNVETLMMVAQVIAVGGEAFAAAGVPRSGGLRCFSVSGHVERPGVYEFPQGTSLDDILAAAGGMKGGRPLKAVIPGGTSTPVLTAEEAKGVKMDFDSLRAKGTFAGAGGVIFLDDTVDMVDVLYVIERFLWTESCGQCTPCREGSGWATRVLQRIREGRGDASDPANLTRLGENITGRVICALGDTVGMVATAMIKKFPEDFAKRAAARAAAPGASRG
ncbi:MAG: NAD(P)H-dependent oxidoreductase subunit E [Elusimicrobia bacterium]|nr:NAD(P)H-dependent oxidoreductase subunit E [Elusimicrobiota bacterium]